MTDNNSNPGGEYDDEVAADGMCDDDDDGPPAPRLPAPLSLRESALWAAAIARILAAKSRGDSSWVVARPLGITRPGRAR
jgi:hypothetical protein